MLFLGNAIMDITIGKTGYVGVIGASGSLKGHYIVSKDGKRDGENITTLDGLKEILDKEFELIDTKDIPFVIQETARKHQYTIAHMTIWQKRSDDV